MTSTGCARARPRRCLGLLSEISGRLDATGPTRATSADARALARSTRLMSSALSSRSLGPTCAHGAPAWDGTRARAADRASSPPDVASSADGPPVQLGDVAYRLSRGVLARHQAPELLSLACMAASSTRTRRFARRGRRVDSVPNRRIGSSEVVV